MRAALKLALDALEKIRFFEELGIASLAKSARAMDAIERALKEEPVAWRSFHPQTNTYAIWQQKPSDTTMHVLEPLYRGDTE